MPEKILVVDDDFETISFLNILLSRQGYQVIPAKNGAEGLKAAHDEHPDLIVLDVMMPDLDGFEVARKLRATPDTAAIPILMFTAKSQINDKVAGYAAGVDFYLTKPVHPLELQANIRSMLTHRRTSAEAAPERGYMVGVVSAQGGVGVSTLALNLAIAYHQKYRSKVMAAEMRPGQGSWAQELNIAKPEGLANLLALEPVQINPNSLDKQLVRTAYEVRLLLASNQSHEVELANAIAQYDALLDQLSLLYRLIVLDIGTSFLPVFDRVADLCNEMILVVEPQPACIRKTAVLIEELKLKGYMSSKVLTPVIVNRSRSDMSLTLSQIEEQLGVEVPVGFPPLTEQAHTASLKNIPMIMLQPEGLIVQQFTTLADLIARRVTA